jgi:hypothetical protein
MQKGNDMIIKTMTYDEYYKYQYEEHEDDEEEYYDETLVETDEFGENDSILLYGPAVRIPELDLIIASGVFLQYNEETGLSEPDWDICLIYENVSDEQFAPEKFLYFEQGVEFSAIANFTRMRGDAKIQNVGD